MNKGCDRAELISAYADGELSGAQALDVEAHIGACRECSDLLALYREITEAVNGEGIPVPDALRANVMSKIKPGKPNPFRRYLPVIMPLAACFVVALLVWGVYEAYPRTAYEGAGSSGGNTAPQQTGAGGADYLETSTSAADGAHFDGGGAESQAEPVDEAESEADNDDSFNALNREPSPIFGDSEHPREMPWDLAEQLGNEGVNTARAELDADAIGALVLGASHWIVVVGELPPFLSELEPEPIDMPLGWDYAYVVADESVSLHIDQLNKLEMRSAAPTFYNAVSNSASPNRGYAVVFYSLK